MEATPLPGTVEHLLALRPIPPLDTNAPEVKQRLSLLRNEMTHLLMLKRWRKITEDEIANQIVSLIQVGPFQQWRSVLPAMLYEIDRMGSLLPIWLRLIERGDPPHISRQTDPTTNIQAYTRRMAILLLGYYKRPMSTHHSLITFADQTQSQELTRFLGSLLLDPSISQYASRSLAIMGTCEALEELLHGFAQAQDWPKIDILKCCLSLQQEAFYPLLLSSGLQRLHGLEPYAAHALYHTLPLDTYLYQPQLSAQAAFLLYWMFSEHTPSLEPDSSPQPLFENGRFSDNVCALFYSARYHRTWQDALALHELGKLLGHYWQAMQYGDGVQSAILSHITPCLPMMPEIEQWLHETGNDLLSNALHTSDATLRPLIERTLCERQATSTDKTTSTYN
ncbi:hypothetical protein [Ktedonospora formicarum]|nr:hypothetical protein [Ktedonospora formicarum]